jgi:hypothetical protein
MTKASRHRQLQVVRRLANQENRDPVEMYRLVVDAGLRVFLRKHRLGCGFNGCQKRCCSHLRGQMRLVWPTTDQ